MKSHLTAAYFPFIWCVSFIHTVEGRFLQLTLSKVSKSSREAGLCPAGKQWVFNRLQSSEGDRKQTLCAAKWDIFLTAVSAAFCVMNWGRSTPTRQLYSFRRGWEHLCRDTSSVCLSCCTAGSLLLILHQCWILFLHCCLSVLPANTNPGNEQIVFAALWNQNNVQLIFSSR